MNAIITRDTVIALGETFLVALAARDFDHIAGLFQPHIRFRALVPSGLREGTTAREAADWFRRWYGDAGAFQMLDSAVDQIVDRLAITYRIQLRKPDGWQVIEQHAYCDVVGDRIADMALLCSGFLPDPQRRGANDQWQLAQPRLGADAFYDAGDKGCGEGPIDAIAGLMHRMQPGQTLEVRATDPSVVADLPAWCRLAGHELVTHEVDRYLIRRK